MKQMLLSLTALLSLITASNTHAEEVPCVGTRGLKALLNAVSFGPESLEKVGASHEVVRMEQAEVSRRSMKTIQLTAIDAVLDIVELSKNSLFLKIQF